MFSDHRGQHLKVLVAQSRLILCDPVNCSLPGSLVPGILQARILEWAAIPFFGDLPNPGIEPGSLALQADSLPSEPPGKAAPIAILFAQTSSQITIAINFNYYGFQAILPVDPWDQMFRLRRCKFL